MLMARKRINRNVYIRWTKEVSFLPSCKRWIFAFQNRSFYYFKFLFFHVFYSKTFASLNKITATNFSAFKNVLLKNEKENRKAIKVFHSKILIFFHLFVQTIRSRLRFTFFPVTILCTSKILKTK